MTIKIIHGDCRTVLATLPDQSVQCCVTSPPYFGLRDYNVAGQIGLEETPAAYVAEMVAVFRQVWRVLRDDGVLWLNLGDSYANDAKWGGTSGGKHVVALHGDTGIGRIKKTTGLKPKDLMMIPARVALALQADGWFLRSEIIWHKPNPMPESVTDRPTNAHEKVFLLTKRERYFYDASAIMENVSSDSLARNARFKSVGAVPDRADSGGFCGTPESGTRNARNVWTITSQPFSGAHFATMPPDLVERCINAGTSDRGACPSCRSPWERVTTKGEPDEAHRAACGADSSGGYNGQSTKGHDAAGVQNASDVKRRILDGMRLKTFYWRQTCECPEADPRPCVVLDPFSGAGTTSLVADRLGRDAIGIELNPEYIKMTRSRISADAGMFASVVVA